MKKVNQFALKILSFSLMVFFVLYYLVFIRQALFESSVRLDGRGITDCRDVSITLSRSEKNSTSEVQIGDTFVITVVSGEIVAPYPDRPTDGILQFNADVSTLAENSGFLHSDLSRLLERAIRESESIDTESLCIIGGEKVWMINCEVKVLDCSGGNVIDACMLSAMSALRAFRKPETSVVSAEPSEIEGESIESGIIVHHSDDREPLPLALHHTPLSVSLGVFKNTSLPAANNAGGEADEGKVKGVSRPLLLVTDPTLQEEAAMDGRVSFSINAHRWVMADWSYFFQLNTSFSGSSAR
jgi:exosome complex component RRP45